MSSTTVERIPHTAQLEEGVHDAVIKAVEAVDGIQTAYGVKDVIYITFDVDGIDVRRRYNKSWNTTSALFKLVSDLRPGELPTKFDVAELVGDACRVMIAHNSTDSGDEWDNIVQVAKRKKVMPTFDELADDPELAK